MMVFVVIPPLEIKLPISYLIAETISAKKADKKSWNRIKSILSIGDTISLEVNKTGIDSWPKIFLTEFNNNCLKEFNWSKLSSSLKSS